MSTPHLYSVATPIGNMQDLSHRAQDVLSKVDSIICEDTRELRKILHHYEIPTPTLLSYHAQSPQRREEEIIARLRAGEQMALVCDRGTPGIADPGARLVHRALAAGISVTPIPGPSAFLTALQASGAQSHHFRFCGFVPHKKGRQTFLRNVIADNATSIFYESPHRILSCLQMLCDQGIGSRPMIVAREVTKMHEEFLRGIAEEILRSLASRPRQQGEFVVIIDAMTK